MKRFSICIALAALGCGCVSNPKDLAPLINALSSDNATARISVHTATFSIEVDRVNPGTNTVNHSIKDGTITVGK